MPRRSRADLAVIAVSGEPTRLPPPADLDATARQLWITIVAAQRADHFRQSDVPLLRRYVENCCIADEATKQMRVTGGPVVGDKISPWFTIRERAVRQMTVLANRLRLAPSARRGAREAGRAVGPVSYYDIAKMSDDPA